MARFITFLALAALGAVEVDAGTMHGVSQTCRSIAKQISSVSAVTYPGACTCFLPLNPLPTCTGFTSCLANTKVTASEPPHRSRVHGALVPVLKPGPHLCGGGRLPRRCLHRTPGHPSGSRPICGDVRRTCVKSGIFEHHGCAYLVETTESGFPLS